MITRVALRNYKSVVACDVALAPLAIVVGRNGAGKSNFLDALRFTVEALGISLEHALRERGGIAEVCHRGVPRPHYFGTRLDFRLADTPGSQRPGSVQRLADYLAAVVPEIAGVDSQVVGNRLVLRFHQRTPGEAHLVKYILATACRTVHCIFWAFSSHSCRDQGPDATLTWSASRNPRPHFIPKVRAC